MAALVRLICLVTLVGCFGLSAQQEQQEPLSNDDVLGMVKAGLSVQVIDAAIRNASCDFDLSPESLIALKKAAVPDAILTVMVEKANGSAGAGAGSEVVVQDATEIVVKLLAPISSATAHQGDPVELEAVEDVFVDGRAVIRRGAKTRGEIAEVRQKKGFGRSGKLNMTIHSVEAVDGQRIPLRATREARGSDNFGKAGVVTLLAGPFGIFVKGKDVEVAAGTEYTIFTDGERRIKTTPAGP